MSTRKRYVVGISGASGALYAIRLVEALLRDPEREVYLIISPLGIRLLTEELPKPPKIKPFDPHSFLDITEEQAGRLYLLPHPDVGAGPASGTFRFEAMIVVPCSVKTVGEIASGLADNLISRGSDVALKEGRPLILMVRETPFSAIHLENMLRLSHAGAIIMPACPAFYHRPETIEDIVGFMVQKVFDRLGMEYPGAFRWGEPGHKDGPPA